MVLDVRNVKKTYVSRSGFMWKNVREVPALQDVTFRVKKGEIFGFLGPNGAGKTTTVNILSGILKEDSGTIKLFGRAPCEESRNRMNVATAYNPLNHNITVFQNLHVFAKMYDVKNPKEKVTELVKKFGIHHLAQRPYYMLSAGEKTRAVLCKGLINDPELILLDEATVGLDPDIAQKVRDEIKNYNTTILFTSHNMGEVEDMCKRTAFISNGKILKVGTIKQLKKMVKEQIVTIHYYELKQTTLNALKKLPIEIIKNEKNTLVLKVKYANKSLHDVLEPLLITGLTIKDMYIDKPSLEDVFLEVART